MSVIKVGFITIVFLGSLIMVAMYLTKNREKLLEGRAVKNFFKSFRVHLALFGDRAIDLAIGGANPKDVQET